MASQRTTGVFHRLPISSRGFYDSRKHFTVAGYSIRRFALIA